MESPFDVLEIDPGADEGAIERAYRRRVKETHPDQGGSAREFTRVRRAYERLLAGEAAVDVEAESGATTNGTRPGAADATGGDGSDPFGSVRGTESRVEYLDYEVLADHGWTLEDEDLFAKAADAGLPDEDYGRFLNRAGESLLEAAENRGFAWPYACRGGACANCAVLVKRGELSMPVDHILPPEMLERDLRLSCQGRPITDELQVVYNVKHLPDLDDLRLPPRPWRETHLSD